MLATLVTDEQANPLSCAALTYQNEDLPLIRPQTMRHIANRHRVRHRPIDRPFQRRRHKRHPIERHLLNQRAVPQIVHSEHVVRQHNHLLQEKEKTRISPRATLANKKRTNPHWRSTTAKRGCRTAPPIGPRPRRPSGRPPSRWSCPCGDCGQSPCRGLR